MVENGEIKLDLALVSSILNYADYRSLTCYICVQTHKELVKDEYVSFEDLKNLAFFNENDWKKSMDKLVNMGLAQKNGSKYITRSKLNKWKEFAYNYTKDSFKLNGYLLFDVFQLIKQKNNEDLKDLIYLTIHSSVFKGKSISRKFVKLVTGISTQGQKNIEKKYKNTFLNVTSNHIPVTDVEIKNNKVGNIPVFRGFFSPKRMDCIKTSVKKSNCDVIQLGNKLKIDNLNLSRFLYKKGSFVKHKSNLDQLNNFKSVNEVDDWDDLCMVYDVSEDCKSIKSKGIISCHDKRYFVNKEIKRLEFDRVALLKNDGTLTNLRTDLNK